MGPAGVAACGDALSLKTCEGSGYKVSSSRATASVATAEVGV